jgi:hypothetical protein
MAIVCFTGAALVISGSKSSTYSTKPQGIPQDPESNKAKLDCDIDGPRKALEECPEGEVIRQYREEYDLTVVRRGGVYWEVISGEYVNDTYGYRVVLPEGIVGLCAPAPAPWHGFLIDLGDELSQPSNADANSVGLSWLDLEVGLWFDGSYNAAFYDSVDEAADAGLTYLKAEHPDDLIILEREHTTFNQLPAIHSCIQFRSTKTGETLITDETMVLRQYDDMGIIYTVNLTSRASRYREDEAVLKRILEGWSATDFE